MDRRGRDQFVIRYGDETEVCWNDHQKQLAEQVCCSELVKHISALQQQRLVFVSRAVQSSSQ